MSKFLLVDMDKLQDYLLSHSEELKKHPAKVNEGSFEDLYLVTMLNRGYFWDKDGKTPVYFSQHVEPSMGQTELIGDLTGWVMDHSDMREKKPKIEVAALMSFISTWKKRFKYG